MGTIQEKRIEDLKTLHALGKEPVRLQVLPDGPDLREVINGERRHFAAGTVFDHPAPARAEQLLAIRPQIVRRTNAPTAAEQRAKTALKTEVDKLTVNKEVLAQAEKILAQRALRLQTLEDRLRKMNAETLQAEVERRNLRDVAENQDSRLKAIMDDERARIEAGQ